MIIEGVADLGILIKRTRKAQGLTFGTKIYNNKI